MQFPPRNRDTAKGGYNPWYSGTAHCTKTATCSLIVIYHVDPGPAFWSDDEPVFLEIYPHYQCNVAIHTLDSAFMVYLVFSYTEKVLIHLICLFTE